ncbi:MAG: hypothetical protein ACFB2Z_05545 [Maricaulaceae bacterium]
MSSNGKLPIIKAAEAGFQFFGAHWKNVLLAAWPLILTNAIASVIALQAFQSGGGGVPLLIGVTGLILIGGLIVAAAFYRMALRQDYSGLLHIQFGGDEARYIGVNALLLLVLLFIAIPSVLAVTFVIVGIMTALGGDTEAISAAASDPQALGRVLGETLGPGGFLLLTALVIGFCLFIFYFFTRLSLALPATIAERRIQIFRTLGWTRGQGWRMVAVFILLILAFLLPDLVFGAIMTLVGVDTNVGNLVMAEQQTLHRAGLVTTVLGYTLFGLYNAAKAAVTSGVLAYMYQGLRSDPGPTSLAAAPPDEFSGP